MTIIMVTLSLVVKLATDGDGTDSLAENQNHGPRAGAASGSAHSTSCEPVFST
jgi:hypothetical protein